MMTTSIKVRTPFEKSIISTCQWEGLEVGWWKDMCLLTQSMKPNIFVNGSKNIPNNIVNNIVFPPHGHIIKGVAPLNLWVDHKCTKPSHELADEGGPT
jgi:hypothetical protein